MEQNYGQLTDEAKLAVRRYMITLVAVPGIVISVLGFLIGFFVDRTATSEAYQEAFNTVQSKVLDLATSVADSAADASQSAKDAKRAADDNQTLFEKTKSLNAEVESLRGRLTTYTAAESGITEDVVTSLLGRPDFLDRVTGEFNERLAAVEGAVQKVPRMSLEVFDLGSSSSNPRSQSKLLGKFQFCSLSQVQLPHANQACGCILKQQNATWTLDLSTDESVKGGCRCSAVCTDLQQG